MIAPLQVNVTSFSSAPAELQNQGLLGWVSIAINASLQLDGIALRRTRAGGLVLAFPERRDRAGRRHSLVRPLDDRVRRAIEVQVFEALRLPATVNSNHED